jgi:dTDP-glucose 4,6-dehydratase
MKTILITGGAGFMASNFVRHLLKKYDDYKIIIVDALTYAGSMENVPKHERVEFWYGDVRNADLIGTLMPQADIVAHFAAETHVTRSIFDNKIFFETDVLGTQCVANSVLKNEQIERFIHISTSEVYGTAIGDQMDEEHPLNPMSPYAAAKAGADRLVYSYYKTYGIPATIIRPFNNYGPRQHLEKVVPRFITSCLLDEPLTVHGNGTAKRDWLFVEDLVKAVDAAIHTDKDINGEVINIGTGQDLDVMTIAEKITDIMGKPRSLISTVGERPGQVSRHTSSTQKAKKLLNWESSISFEEGITRTIQWYRENREWWERILWLRQVPIVTKDGEKEFH